MRWICIRSDLLSQGFLPFLREQNAHSLTVSLLYLAVLIGGTDDPIVQKTLVDEGLAWFENDRFVLKQHDSSGNKFIEIFDFIEKNDESSGERTDSTKQMIRRAIARVFFGRKTAKKHRVNRENPAENEKGPDDELV